MLSWVVYQISFSLIVYYLQELREIEDNSDMDLSEQPDFFKDGIIMFVYA